MNKCKKALKALVSSAIICVVCVCISFLAMCVYVRGISGNKPQGEFDAVVVLGAGLIGDRVSDTLRTRLDAASAYILENDIKTVVVSGGQGKDEWVSEAYAMKEYLVAKSVPEDIIIMEDKSTSTYENFLFTKPMLDEKFSGDYRILFVTNDFHCLRAQHFAIKAGFSADFLPSYTYRDKLIANYAREYLAICYYTVFDGM